MAIVGTYNTSYDVLTWGATDSDPNTEILPQTAYIIDFKNDGTMDIYENADNDVKAFAEIPNWSATYIVENGTVTTTTLDGDSNVINTSVMDEDLFNSDTFAEKTVDLSGTVHRFQNTTRI